MPRIARMVMKGEPGVYHVISRTALGGFVLGDMEKDFLLNLIRRLSRVYLAEVLGFCLMGNHFHLLVRMHPGENISDEEIKQRFSLYYGKEREIFDGQIPYLREKWSSLSEYVKEIKQGFSRYYNRRHNRRGFFWSDRFKSVIVDNGETLINCLAYIDLNPVRAGIVDKPESYRWCSLGFHVQRNNQEEFLSLDFGLAEFGVLNERKRLSHYRRFVQEKGKLGKNRDQRSEVGSLKDRGWKDQRTDDRWQTTEGKARGQKDRDQRPEVGNRKKLKDEGYEIGVVDRFRYRTRYFTDSGIIGSKVFVDRVYRQFKDHFSSKNEKQPRTIKGLEGVYSLKRLSEAI
jgi:putative transposase